MIIKLYNSAIVDGYYIFLNLYLILTKHNYFSNKLWTLVVNQPVQCLLLI